MDEQSLPNPLDRRSLFPPRITRQMAQDHWQTKQTIRGLPRSMLGMSLLWAMGKMPPMPTPRATPALTKQSVVESAARIQTMREELATEGPTAVAEARIVAADHAGELRDSVTRSEAQRTFEGQMRARALRGTLKA